MGCRVTLAAKVAISTETPPLECPLYLAILEDAVAKEPPPFDTAFYEEVYREAATDPAWLAVSLITNAEREADGSRRLWSLAACCDDNHHRSLLKRHAVDESRHAQLYLAMLDTVFPTIVTESLRSDLNRLSPRYSLSEEPTPVEGSPYARKPTIDDFVQMNIAEIRTTIHHIMQRHALCGHLAPGGQNRINAIQDALLGDELRHVAYTAVLIDKIGAEMEIGDLAGLFCRRLHDFNNITRHELSDGVFD